MSLRQVIVLLFPTHSHLGAFVVGITALGILLTLVGFTCHLPLSDSNSTCFLSINLIGLLYLAQFLYFCFYQPKVALVVGLLWLVGSTFLDAGFGLKLVTFVKTVL